MNQSATNCCTQQKTENAKYASLVSFSQQASDTLITWFVLVKNKNFLNQTTKASSLFFR